MVSLPSIIPSPAQEKKERSSVENSLSRRRKYRDGEEDDDQYCFVNMPKLAKAMKKADIELPLQDTPLPMEWQQCLDIKSGEIHFYNIKTHKRTFQDPRLPSPKLPIGPCLSLDLKLNLVSETTPTSQVDGGAKDSCGGGDGDRRSGCDTAFKTYNNDDDMILSLDTDRQEMVATVCTRCHMLVMMRKSTLSCPNCKFVHPHP